MSILHWTTIIFALLAGIGIFAWLVAAVQGNLRFIQQTGSSRVFQSIACTLLLLCLLLGISTIQTQMNQMRKKYELTEGSVLKNAPPVVAFVTVALGGFRGLLADFLFLRSQKVQDREDFFELVQLADWIVKLQPRFTGAIAFLAWNMSYNVSVVFSDCRDRWRWVQRGIELIRDQALRYHPGDPKLYKELGWLYQHKVGQILDDCNRYYKAQLAMQMIETLGNEPRFRWKWLAGGADTQKALMTQIGSKNAAAFQQILDKADMTFNRLEYDFRHQADYPPKIKKAILALPCADDIERCLRKRWLKARCNLDADYIAKMIERFGYLDFRLPEAHAIYWASKGLDAAENHVDIDCDRMIFQSMKDSFVRGRLIYLTKDNYPFTGPNIEVVDAVRASYLKAAKEHKGNSSIMSGYENFMKDAIVIMFTSGYKKKAAQYLNFLRKSKFGGKKEYRKSIERYALDELAKDISGKSTFQVQAIIGQLLWQANIILATDDPERATNLIWLAQQVYRKYTEDVSTDVRCKMRKGFPKFKVIRREMTKVCLRQFHPELAARLRTALRLSGVDVDELEKEIKKQSASPNLLDSGKPKDLSIQRQ